MAHGGACGGGVVVGGATRGGVVVGGATRGGIVVGGATRGGIVVGGVVIGGVVGIIVQLLRIGRFKSITSSWFMFAEVMYISPNSSTPPLYPNSSMPALYPRSPTPTSVMSSNVRVGYNVRSPIFLVLLGIR